MDHGDRRDTSRFPDDTYRFCWRDPDSYRELFSSPAPCRRPWAIGLILWLVFLLAAELPIILGHVLITGALGIPLLLCGLLALGGLVVCLGWSFLAAATSYRTATRVVAVMLLLILLGIVWAGIRILEESRN